MTTASSILRSIRRRTRSHFRDDLEAYMYKRALNGENVWVSTITPVSRTAGKRATVPALLFLTLWVYNRERMRRKK